MKHLRSFLHLLILLLTCSLIFLGLSKRQWSIADIVLLIAFGQILLTYSLKTLYRLTKVTSLKRLYYFSLLISTGITALMLAVAVLFFSQNANFMLVLVFAPITTLFFLELFSIRPKSKKVKENKEVTIVLDQALDITQETLIPSDDSIASIEDPQRRAFLKLLGGAGLGLLVHLLINPRQAGAAFFGSVPGPGTVSVKDSNNQKIDPAIKSPTDAYGITQIDDQSSPAYYGFVNKEGEWYITQEDSSGSYRYARGGSDFQSNWSNRATLSYNYFNSVF